MILVDVNILVYAFDAASTHHLAYRTWLTNTLDGRTEVGLADATLVGFVRIVTNQRIFERPATTPQAMEFANAIARSPRARWLVPTARTWDEFDDITGIDRQLRANHLPDAWLAALAITHGGRLATADRGFARFADLDWFDPIAV